MVFRNMLDYGAVGDGVTVSPVKEKAASSTRTPIRVNVFILTYPLPGDRMIQKISRARWQMALGVVKHATVPRPIMPSCTPPGEVPDILDDSHAVRNAGHW